MVTITFDGKNLLARTGYIAGAVFWAFLLLGLFKVLTAHGTDAGYVGLGLTMLFVVGAPFLLVPLTTLVVAVYRGTKKGRGLATSIFVGLTWGMVFYLLSLSFLALFLLH